MVTRIIILLLISASLQAQMIQDASPSYIPSGPTWTNLISHWPLLNNDLTDVHGTDDMTATNAVNSGDSCFYFDGTGDYLSFTGTTNKVVTFIMEVWPVTVTSYDLWGGAGSNGTEVYTVSSHRPRVVKGGASGTTVPVLALTTGEWNFVTIVADDASGDGDVVYGVDGTYETETDWTQTITDVTDRIGTGSAGNDFQGYIRNIWVFSDLKAESYNTGMYNSGDPLGYADGDPE